MYASSPPSSKYAFAARHRLLSTLRQAGSALFPKRYRPALVASSAASKAKRDVVIRRHSMSSFASFARRVCQKSLCHFSSTDFTSTLHREISVEEFRYNSAISKITSAPETANFDMPSSRSTNSHAAIFCHTRDRSAPGLIDSIKASRKSPAVSGGSRSKIDFKTDPKTLGIPSFVSKSSTL